MSTYNLNKVGFWRCTLSLLLILMMINGAESAQVNYDGSWRTGSPLLPRGNKGMAVGEYQGIISIIGGDWHPSQSLVEYDISNQQMTEINLYYLSQEIGAWGQFYTQQSNIVYMIDAQNSSGGSFSIMDLQTKTFTTNWNDIVINTKVGRAGCLTSTQYYLYVVGGGDLGTTYDVDTLQVLDLNTLQWLSNVSPMTTIRSRAACIVHHRFLYAISGYYNGYLSSIERIMVDGIENQEWITTSYSLITAVQGHKSISYGHDILVIGGDTANDETKAVQIIDTVANIVTMGPDLVYNTYPGAVIRVDQRVYLFGGTIFYGNSNWDFGTDIWQYYDLPNIPPSTSLPTAIPTTTPTTVSPTKLPTKIPTNIPTLSPTAIPTPSPTDIPTPSPTNVSTVSPTNVPTVSPTNIPTINTSINPTTSPPTTPSPTIPKTLPNHPTISPTHNPTTSPTNIPSIAVTNTVTTKDVWESTLDWNNYTEKSQNKNIIIWVLCGFGIGIILVIIAYLIYMKSGKAKPKTSSFAKEMDLTRIEPERDEPGGLTLESWLNNIGLMQLYDMFVENGFKDGNNAMAQLLELNDEDLDDLGITNMEHRKLILNQMKQFAKEHNNIKPMENESSDSSLFDGGEIVSNVNKTQNKNDGIKVTVFGGHAV